jgi:hypothetical protein
MLSYQFIIHVLFNTQFFSYLNPQVYQGIIKDSYRLLPERKKELSDSSIFFFFFVDFFTTLSLLRIFSVE